MGYLLNKFTGIFVFLSLLILSITLAATEDFQYTAPSSIDVCACTNFVLEGSLVNIGDVTSHYFVSDLGSASAWTQSVPEYFSIDSGIERDVLTFVNVPCNANGVYTLYTKIESSLGLDKIHAAMINVQKCNIIDVTPVKVKHEVCAGDVAIYEFKVENKGGFVEEIQPSVNGLNRYSEFNLPLYTLDVGEVEPVYLYLASFDKTGLYKLNVTLTAFRSGFEYNIPIEYNAVDCAPTAPLQDSISEDDNGIVIPIIPLMPLLYAIIALLIILLLLLLILLIVKVVKKKKSGRTLEEWIEVPVEKKEPKKEEKKVVAEVKKKPAKKVKKKPKKPVDKEKIKKVLLWILIILLALLLLGLVIWGIVATWSNISDWASALGNETANMTANMTNNLTAGVNDSIGSQNITQQPLAPVDNISGNGLMTNQSLNATDINGTNPIVSFFTNYGSSCAMIISLFLVLFILSLLLLGLKQKDEWSDKKKFFMKYLKYALPILFFICLVFTFVFCVFNNIPDETWPGRCSVVIIENATDANVLLNATQLMNQSNVIVEKQALGGCACSTLFGTSTPTWLCVLIVILVILLILLIIWLIMMFPFWWAAFKNRPKRPKKEKKKEIVKVVKKTEKKKESSTSNIWKDILLLLILLILLFLIGFFFRSCDLYTPINDTNGSLDNLSLINATNTTLVNTSQNESGDDAGNDSQGLVVVSPSTEDMVEAPVDQNLVCDVRFFFNIDDTDSISLIPDELKGIKESDLVYSWYLDRNGDGSYEIVRAGIKSKKIPSSQIEVDDIWRCEASFTAPDGKVYSVDSPPYIVVPIEEAEIVLPPINDSEDMDAVNVSDNATVNQNVTNETEEIDLELVKVNELLAYIEENNLTDSFTYFVIGAGETEDVNLSQYFIDPDDDELFFNVEEVTSNNVSIDIWKGIATISAESDFIGIVNATFSAEDPLGEKVIGEMTIVVKPSEKSTFSKWWEDYGNYVIVAIIIVALLIVVIILYNGIMDDDEEVKEKKKEPEKKGDTGFFKNF